MVQLPAESWQILVGNMGFVRAAQYLAVALFSMACILLCNSTVRVHDSQAYRKMEVTKECTSHISEL